MPHIPLDKKSSGKLSFASMKSPLPNPLNLTRAQFVALEITQGINTICEQKKEAYASIRNILEKGLPSQAGTDEKTLEAVTGEEIKAAFSPDILAQIEAEIAE